MTAKMFTTDWHMHTKHSCDEACMEVTDLLARAPVLGIAEFGISDHLHTPVNLPDVVASREDYLRHRRAGFHFGIEVSVVSEWELAELAAGRGGAPVYGIRRGGDPTSPPAIGITEEQLRGLGVEYAVGGAHWPLYTEMKAELLIRDYHRQNMFLAADPRVDIVAHPWWWMGNWKDPDGRYTSEPWLGDFGVIPASMHDEFAAALKENDTHVEANIGAMLTNPEYTEKFRSQYAEYLRYLFEKGVGVTIGSDCHDAHYGFAGEAAEALLRAAGFREGDFGIPRLRNA